MMRCSIGSDVSDESHLEVDAAPPLQASCRALERRYRLSVRHDPSRGRGLDQALITDARSRAETPIFPLSDAFSRPTPTPADRRSGTGL